MTRPRRIWTGLVLLTPLIAALVLSGCSVPRSGASATSEVGGCASVLPLARHAVRGQGTLTLIRRVDKDQIAAITTEVGAIAPPPPSPPSGTRPPPQPPPTDATTGQPLPKTCVVVYRGHYPTGTVDGTGPSASSGQYAIIVLRVRHPAVDRVFVVDQLPAGLPR